MPARIERGLLLAAALSLFAGLSLGCGEIPSASVIIVLHFFMSIIKKSTSTGTV
jgi:hypothetical protein